MLQWACARSLVAQATIIHAECSRVACTLTQALGVGVGTAVFFAVIAGSIFFSLNKKVFGIESINFLGLPYMVSKESEGHPIYVCAADKPQ